MTKRIKLRLLALCLTAAFMLLGVSALSQLSLAREQQRKFQAGEMVDTGGGISAKILRCRGAGDNEECEVQYYRGDALESTPRWESTYFLRQAEERIRASRKQQGIEQSEAENTNRATPQPATIETNETETNKKTMADCSFTPPAADASKTALPSEQLFKRKIYDRYNVFANGSATGPLKVGVTFLSFEVSKPFTNIVRVDKGVGAYRINDAAPVNATIYPVKSEHIVCEQYRDGTLRKRVANKYACFKNKDGEWVCGADGVPKTTQLN
jgi:hypothetical protein